MVWPRAYWPPGESHPMARLAVPVLVTTVIALGSCSKTSVGTSAEAQVRIDILHECLPALYEKLDAILDLAEAWRLCPSR